MLYRVSRIQRGRVEEAPKTKKKQRGKARIVYIYRIRSLSLSMLNSKHVLDALSQRQVNNVEKGRKSRRGPLIAFQTMGREIIALYRGLTSIKESRKSKMWKRIAKHIVHSSIDSMGIWEYAYTTKLRITKVYGGGVMLLQRCFLFFIYSNECKEWMVAMNWAWLYVREFAQGLERASFKANTSHDSDS